MRCARCGREVYYAELKVAGDNCYHAFCFSCYRCRKLLDSCSINTCEGELYCNSCYKCYCNPCNYLEKIDFPPRACCRKVRAVANCRDDRCCDLDVDPCCERPCRSRRRNKDRPRCMVRCCPKVRDPCDVPCRPLRCVPCPDPCCTCCGKTNYCCPTETDNFCLRPTIPAKKCVPRFICLEEVEEPTCMGRSRSCSPICCTKPCCQSQSPCCPKPCHQPVKRCFTARCCRRSEPPVGCCGACAAPSPREVSNYYNRNHPKNLEDTCKGRCYCPEDCCCCRNRSPPCPSRSCADRCCPRPSCCPRPNCSPRQNCCTTPNCDPRPNCDRCCNEPGSGCGTCCTPYCPPPRKPVCYPPVKCCEDDPCAMPRERICFYPCSTPHQPQCCTCGMPNPCSCDPNERRAYVIEKCTPNCRRCGRKVYPAEKIMSSYGPYHTCCFSCYCCHKFLEVTNVFETHGEIYCKRCCSKHFGPHGYGYGATLQSNL